MRRAFFAIVLTTGITSASATVSTPSLTTPAKLTPEAAAASILVSAPEHAKINTSFRPVATAQAVAQDAVSSQSDELDSGWRYFATLFSTLALIVAIAVRRHLAGKH